jgi:hypothetical protein
MPRGRHTAITICLTRADLLTLETWQRSSTIRAGLARRGRMILLVAEGRTISDVATLVGISRRFVYKWVQRFLAQGVEGLRDKPRGDLQATPQTRDLSAHGTQGHKEW